MKKQLKILTATLMLAVSGAASSSVITYTTRSAFNAAHPGLGVETFQNAFGVANPAVGIFATMTGPLSSATNNAIFAAGSILPGLHIADNPGPNVGDLVVLGTGTVTGATKSVGAGHFPDGLSLAFDTGDAVGFDVFLASGPGAPASASVSIAAFDAGGSIFTGNFALTGIGFFGIGSTTAITHVELLNASLSEFVDNVAFGPAPSVPEPATLLLTGAGLASLAWSRRRT